MKLEHTHTRAAIAARLAMGARPNYLRDFVYGGIDGAITTFAVVAGVVGASLSTPVILILGMANLLADGFSMAASNYSGTKTVTDEIDRIREIESRHIRYDPEGEREEIRQILAAKGLDGHVLEEAVQTITANRKTWIDMMVVEEYGISLNQPSPLKAAAATFTAFVICGAVPLLPFAVGLPSAFPVSIVTTALVFFLIGAAKSGWSLAPWWRSGTETLLIGSVAAIVAFVVGHLLRGLA